MGSNITLGRFYRADSFLHAMDPRVKLALTLAFLVIVFFAGNIWGFLFTAAFLALAISFSGVPFKVVLKSLKPLVFLIVFTFALNVLLTPTGDIWFKFGIIKITDDGVIQAAKMAVRLVYLVAGTSLMTLTTPPIRLTDGFESLLSPLKLIKFPAHEIAMMMTVALRFIPTLIDEADKIMKAQSARGASFDTGSLLQRAKAMIPLLVPLFISAFMRADELAMAMEARCYHGGEGRTRMNVPLVGVKDYAACGIVAVYAACVFIWGRP